MKKFGILFFFFSFACGAALTAQTAKEISIKETIGTTPVLLSSVPVPVDAQMIGRQIDLAFLANMGAVVVTVENGQGLVFQTSFAATDGAEAFINAENWSDGDYTITIVRSDDGKMFIGDFELEQE